MLERQLEYERVRLEAESRKACLESQEKVHVDISCNHSSVWSYSFLQERLRAQLASSLSLNRTVSRQSSTGNQVQFIFSYWVMYFLTFHENVSALPVLTIYIFICRVMFLRSPSMLPVRVGGLCLTCHYTPVGEVRTLYLPTYSSVASTLKSPLWEIINYPRIPISLVRFIG